MLCKEKTEVVGHPPQMALSVYYRDEQWDACAIFGLSRMEASIPLPFPPNKCRKLLDSADPRWGGTEDSLQAGSKASADMTIPLRPRSFVLLEKLS
jgi:hypothetical protein